MEELQFAAKGSSRKSIGLMEAMSFETTTSFCPVQCTYPCQNLQPAPFAPSIPTRATDPTTAKRKLL
jgi:hypothetical protein